MSESWNPRRVTVEFAGFGKFTRIKALLLVLKPAGGSDPNRPRRMPAYPKDALLGALVVYSWTVSFYRPFKEL